MTADFIINERFVVRVSTNVVEDREAGGSVRMEPRHMKVLCSLAAQEGQLVERQTLITELWQNYGGADDALTQAISYLRKVLHDDGKSAIETVPKGGYILHARIAPVASPVASDPIARRSPRGMLIAGGAVVLLLLLIWFLRSGDPVAPVAPVDSSGGHEEAIAPEAP